MPLSLLTTIASLLLHQELDRRVYLSNLGKQPTQCSIVCLVPSSRSVVPALAHKQASSRTSTDLRCYKTQIETESAFSTSSAYP
ncbi:hypothetical protein BU16DRAFT_203507 [Lophium mytilinum]|uniref:Uncharacterized protein n=1 Tax=Lophium mytilinum TaxID=390894 RepID=A0A6A6RCW9_9PEZI|nr:hypothetical protein BU16DRAFT_203507 [Lophium mytilinum]